MDQRTGTGPDLPLAGRTIGVTAARRVTEQREHFERRGARVVAATGIRMVSGADDAAVHEATGQALAGGADVVVVTTVGGLRLWEEAAAARGRGDGLAALLRSTPVYSRGAKVTGALRARDIREAGVAADETSAEILRMLTATGVAGRRVVVQTQGAGGSWHPMSGLVDGLRAAGAEVVEVPTYRWEPVLDDENWDALVRATAGGEVDALTFTSAPAVVATLDRAEELGVAGELRAALCGPVVPLCVGPVTAEPLVARGVEPVVPERMRLGALLRLADRVLG